MKYILIFFLCLGPLFADDDLLDEKGKKVLYVNLAASAAIVSWGVWQWDYGDRRMHSTKERWFSRDTPYGGVDKLGHVYMTYLYARGFSSLYRSYGYERKKAAAYGALSSFCMNGIMEVGDAFSSYGFSREDFLANLLGSLGGYLLERNERLDRLMDMRIEYMPTSQIRSGDSIDIFTDYDGMKFLAAFKLDSVFDAPNSYAKYLEFHVGYFTRNNGGAELQRNAYVALGVNLSTLFHADDGALHTLFEYYQPPYTYLPGNRRIR